MRRSMLIILAVLLGLLIAACAPAGTPAPATSAPATNAPTTNVPQAQATEPPATTASAANTPEATKPAATPDIQKVIKAQPDDWKRGPDGAPVTIIEWSDFQ